MSKVRQCPTFNTKCNIKCITDGMWIHEIGSLYAL